MLYIKTPRALAAYLNLLDSRSTFADGNYLLWDRDLMRLCGSGSIEELIPQIGSVTLTAPEVRAEQCEECEPHPLPPVTLPVLLEYMQSHGYPLPESDPDTDPGEHDTDTGRDAIHRVHSDNTESNPEYDQEEEQPDPDPD